MSELLDYDKMKIALRYWLLGAASQNKDYYLAVRAMELAMEYHNGTRKDGVTPEFSHQLEIVSRLRTRINDLMFPVETIVVAFLHDLLEDYGPTDKVWTENLDRLRGLVPVTKKMIVDEFGKVIADATDKISKVVDGKEKSKEVYYKEMAKCPISSICKGEDRGHNMDSMIGVFPIDKQERYTHEVSKYFLPMLKEARRNFPQQEAIYEGQKSKLESQSAMIMESVNIHKTYIKELHGVKNETNKSMS